MPTHTVVNQVPPLHDHDISTFPALLEGLHREGAGWADQEVTDLGALAGSTQAQTWSELANARTPVLRTHDRYGFRVDER